MLLNRSSCIPRLRGGKLFENLRMRTSVQFHGVR